LESALLPDISAPLTPEELSRFEQLLSAHRERMYDYLMNWPGASAFRPAEIHEALFSYAARRGKALRPLLLLLSCEAVGGDQDRAVPAAAAVEIFHTWTLVHDDIIDRDRTRRGKPTVHAQYEDYAREALNLPSEAAAHYGLSVAILAGDLQQSWSYALMGDLIERGVSAPLALELIRRMATDLTPRLLEGEMLDVQFSIPGASLPTDEAVLDMLSKKTATLLEYAAWCGAKIGLGNAEDSHGYADTLGEFARLCGIAFQLHDDLLGLTADESVLGKPVGSDLREGKLTYIVCRALAKADPTMRTVLASTLGNRSARQEEIAEAIGIVRATGALGDGEILANSYISQALRHLDKLPPSASRDLLRVWAIYVLARRY
jgi:geranylgeranyl diphosphate synthase type I